MKKAILILASVFIFAALAFPQSEITTDGSVLKGDGIKTVQFSGTLDGTDTLTSSSFSLLDCNPVFDFWSYHGANADSVKIKVLRQWKMNDAWATAKTVYAADSLLTLRVLSDTLANYPVENRFIFIGVQAGSGAVTDNGFNKTFTYTVRAPLK